MKPSKAGAHHSGLLLFRDVDGRHRVGGARVGHTGGGRRSALSDVDGRPVRSGLLQGLSSAFSRCKMPRRFPICLQLDFATIYTLANAKIHRSAPRGTHRPQESHRICTHKTTRLPPVPRSKDTKSRSCGLPALSPPILGPGLAYSALSPTSACRHCTRWIHRKPSSPSGLQPDLGFLPPSTTRLWSSGSR
jgi:hypothetical protein